jgi:hypothetical protein
MCSAYNDDILKGHKDLIRKANSILYIFRSSNPAICHIVSLYMGVSYGPYHLSL